MHHCHNLLRSTSTTHSNQAVSRTSNFKSRHLFYSTCSKLFSLPLEIPLTPLTMVASTDIFPSLLKPTTKPYRLPQINTVPVSLFFFFFTLDMQFSLRSQMLTMGCSCSSRTVSLSRLSSPSAPSCRQRSFSFYRQNTPSFLPPLSLSTPSFQPSSEPAQSRPTLT